MYYSNVVMPSRVYISIILKERPTILFYQNEQMKCKFILNRSTNGSKKLCGTVLMIYPCHYNLVLFLNLHGLYMAYKYILNFGLTQQSFKLTIKMKMIDGFIILQ